MPSHYLPTLNGNSTQVVLTGPEHHHVSIVLRQRVGDQVNLNSGNGWYGYGRLIAIDKMKSVIDIDDVHYYPPAVTQYAVAFTLLRNKHDELLTEKLTELGVKELFPMTTKFSVRNPSGSTNKRFQQAALAAIKQCDNPHLPWVHEVQPLFDALLKVIKLGYKPVIASENRPDFWLDNLPTNQNYCFFIGPEGGFNEEEFNLLRGHNAIEICLSPLVLRAETAAIAIAAQFNLIRR